jgi:hypothetical protein
MGGRAQLAETETAVVLSCPPPQARGSLRAIESLLRPSARRAAESTRSSVAPAPIEQRRRPRAAMTRSATRACVGAPNRPSRRFVARRTTRVPLPVMTSVPRAGAPTGSALIPRPKREAAAPRRVLPFTVLPANRRDSARISRLTRRRDAGEREARSFAAAVWIRAVAMLRYRPALCGVRTTTCRRTLPCAGTVWLNCHCRVAPDCVGLRLVIPVVVPGTYRNPLPGRASDTELLVTGSTFGLCRVSV